MDRRDRPPWSWRLLAYGALVLAGLTPLPAVLQSGAVSWQVATNWLAIGGTLAYAHGWPARPLWFWRVFALLFSLYTMASLGSLIGSFFTARVAPEGPIASDWVIFAGTLSICFLVCIALLRHAGLLRSVQRRRAAMYEQIFA